MKLTRTEIDEDLNLDDEEEFNEEEDITQDDDDLFNEDLKDDFFDDVGGATPIDKHNDLLKYLTNFAPYLKETINGWLGITWNEEQGKYTRNKQIEPIMNLKCAAWCVSYLKTYVRPNNIITDIASPEYKNMMSDIVENIWLNIGTRTEEFAIKSNGDILRVCNELEHSAALVLMGAGDGKYNKFLGTVTTRHENINPNQLYPGNMPMPMPRPKIGTMDKIKKAFLGT